MDDRPDLGLFPLDLVLLPGEAVPLHLFEPRYRQLYADCVLENAPFVVVRESDQEREAVGCATRFEELTRRHPDGRLDVLVRGTHPVVILEPTGGRLYRSAHVRALSDEDDPPGEGEQARVVARYREFVGSDPDIDPGSEVPLSYALAGRLPLDPESKQSLLVERSEARRVAMLDAAIARAIERDARVAENARRAAMNGHVPHP
jgi:Lon protease-like protein